MEIKRKNLWQQGMCLISLIVLTGLLLFMGCGQDNGLAEIKITFHDTLLDGSSIKRVDMTILETQIIDMYDNKTVISTDSKSFNLLEITKNNPVALAHTMIAPGTYKQIRLILDPDTTVTLTDDTVHPMKVPSGEMTGIKIDGVFEIPAGKFYTLDIDLDPGQSIHYAAGEGYMLKPVIEITGSHINSGNFIYAGKYKNDAFVTKLNPDGTMKSKTSRYSRYEVVGTYNYVGVNQKLYIDFKKVRCPGCSRRRKLKMKLFAKVPSDKVFDVQTFGADYIDLKEVGSGSTYHLERVPTFSLAYTPPTKDFSLRVTNLDSVWNGTAFGEKTVFGQLIPEDGFGEVFASIETINYGDDAYLDFSIRKSEFGEDEEKKYILQIGVVDSEDDLLVDLETGIVIYQDDKLLVGNCDAATLCIISKDVIVDQPIDIAFENTCSSN